MTHTTAPTTDKTTATSANGSPSKNPSGLQSPILSLSLIYNFLFSSRFSVLILKEVGYFVWLCRDLIKLFVCKKVGGYFGNYVYGIFLPISFVMLAKRVIFFRLAAYFPISFLTNLQWKRFIGDRVFIWNPPSTFQNRPWHHIWNWVTRLTRKSDA